MKVKKHLAIFLVAVMATTVVSAAGVLTAPKAAAVYQTDQYASITYTPEGKYTYGPTQYNYHTTSFAPFYGSSQHTEVSSGGTGTALLRTEAWQNGDNGAEVGMQWRLTNLAGNEDKPVKVTLKVSYTLMVRGGTAVTKAGLRVDSANYGFMMQPYRFDGALGSDPVPVKTVTQTFTWEGPLNKFFSDPGTGALPYGRVEVDAYAFDFSANVPVRVTSTATIQSVTIEFPTSVPG